MMSGWSAPAQAIASSPSRPRRRPRSHPEAQGTSEALRARRRGHRRSGPDHLRAELQPHRGALARSGVDRQACAQLPGALLHRGEADDGPGVPRRRGRASTVVEHLDGSRAHAYNVSLARAWSARRARLLRRSAAPRSRARGRPEPARQLRPAGSRPDVRVRACRVPWRGRAQPVALERRRTQAEDHARSSSRASLASSPRRSTGWRGLRVASNCVAAAWAVRSG